jgi:hypothetical protein
MSGTATSQSPAWRCFGLAVPAWWSDRPTSSPAVAIRPITFEASQRPVEAVRDQLSDQSETDDQFGGGGSQVQAMLTHRTPHTTKALHLSSTKRRRVGTTIAEPVVSTPPRGFPCRRVRVTITPACWPGAPQYKARWGLSNLAQLMLVWLTATPGCWHCSGCIRGESCECRRILARARRLRRWLRGWRAPKPRRFG